MNGKNYIYNQNGELTSVTDTGTGQTTSYGYDALGNLKQVTLPNSNQITYVIDAMGRRLQKLVNGVHSRTFIWQSQLQIAGELDSSGGIRSRFVYRSKSHVPDYMVQGGVNYKILTDHLGSIRLVVNSSTGAVVQRLDYDEYGKIKQDTNPGFQPFGFAGGLYDPDTNLVHFGARDYDPETGRWTSKDPILFAGGDTNLYGYVLQDPVNLIDPDGKFAVPLLLPFVPAIVEGIAVVGSAIGAGWGISELINVFNDKRLTPGEIDRLKKAGIDPHDLKKQLGKSRSDLFKRPNGDVCVKPKDGSGPGEDTGFNINDLFGKN